MCWVLVSFTLFTQLFYICFFETQSRTFYVYQLHMHRNVCIECELKWFIRSTF